MERAPAVVLSGVPRDAVTPLEAGGGAGGALDGRLRHVQVGFAVGCKWMYAGVGGGVGSCG